MQNRAASEQTSPPSALLLVPPLSRGLRDAERDAPSYGRAGELNPDVLSVGPIRSMRVVWLTLVLYPQRRPGTKQAAVPEVKTLSPGCRGEKFVQRHLRREGKS